MIHGLSGNPDWATPAKVTEFDVNARLTFTGIMARSARSSNGGL